MNRAPRLLCVLAAAVVLVAPARAGAQSAADKAAAEALFEQGTELLEQKKLDEACRKLEASQKLDPGLGTMLYLADCYEQVNRLASAWALFREAESLAKGRGDEKRAQVAGERADALEPRLSKLTITVADGNDPGLTVTRNGTAIPPASWGTAIPVDAGKHVIEASAPGKQAFAETVTLAGDRAIAGVDVPVLADAPSQAPARAAPPPSASETPPASPPADTGPRDDGNGQRVAGLVVGGVGVAGLIVGAAFGLNAKSKNDDSMQFCPNDERLCSQRGVELRDDAKSAATISTVAMSIGAAAVAAGIVIYLTAPDDSEATSLAVSTGIGPGGARVGVGGSF